MQYKIGDKVVLRPETKPYTFFALIGGNETEEIDFKLEEDIYYTVAQVYEDDDVWIENDDNDVYVPINIKHLKHANESTAFEEYQDELYQRVSDSVTSLESDLKAELEKLEEIDLVELRLSIFNGNTSRTLEEMKDIEAWILGESK